MEQGSLLSHDDVKTARAALRDHGLNCSTCHRGHYCATDDRLYREVLAAERRANEAARGRS